MVSIRSLGIGFIGFFLGVFVMALLVQNADDVDRAVVISDTPATEQPGAARSISPVTKRSDVTPSIRPAPSPRDCDDPEREVTRVAVRTPPSETDAIAYLRSRNLHLPVAGVAVDDLHSSFEEKRGNSRQHEAIDILAPRETPVHAIDDGCVARLFESKAGGITLYQFDPTGTYTYYYAHLERYADEIDEGDALRRGQLIGYVGTSGNAPPNTPHLHLAIFILGPEKRWWQGTPIDPYDVWHAGPPPSALN